jgi:hypothetical protein
MTEHVQATFLQGSEVCKRLGVSKNMLNNWRYKGLLIEGAHWARANQTTVLYNLELVQHFMHWSHQPVAHMAAVARYQESLPYQQLCFGTGVEAHQGQPSSSLN